MMKYSLVLLFIVLPILPLACSSGGGNNDDDTVPNDDDVQTEYWDGTFSEPVARPEHPRPDWRRDTFINLNTTWQFAYDPDDVGIADEWFDRTDVWTDEIQVPFPWEAPASGLVEPRTTPYQFAEAVTNPTYRGVAWYRLELPAPLEPTTGLDWHLVFGAIDYDATVWINGELATEHSGGYIPFSLNLSAHVPDGESAIIVVRVFDECDTGDFSQPLGKQGGLWYTRTSGIWQTVYLEQRPATYIETARLVPDLDTSTLHVQLTLSDTSATEISLTATLDGEEVGTASGTATAGDAELDLPLSVLEPWSHHSPTLYDLTITAGDDTVTTYFGMVEYGIDWVPGHSPDQTATLTDQYSALTVNGEPVYLRCALDQSFYPEGIHTAPSLDAIRRDLEIARDYGLNCLRVHIKIDEPVKYRLLDEYGFYVLYDMPSFHVGAKNQAGFAGRPEFERMVRSAIDRDANHPSIMAWIVFNENWGLAANGGIFTSMADNPEIQQWVREMVAVAREADPTRPIEDNSPALAEGLISYEHVTGDLHSFHWYLDPDEARTLLEEQAPEIYPGSPHNFLGDAVQTGQPWFNSEFSAHSATDGADSEEAYCKLFALINEQRRVPKQVGWTITQLTDVEWEYNGLANYDRTPKDIMCAEYGISLADAFTDEAIVIDWLPDHALPVGQTVDLPFSYNRWEGATNEPRTLRWGWNGEMDHELEIDTVRYDLTLVEDASTTAPAEPGQYWLTYEALDDDGVRATANKIPISVQ